MQTNARVADSKLVCAVRSAVRPATAGQLDIKRRPAGASLHLLLGLYALQGRKLDAVLEHADANDAARLGEQAQAELTLARAALRELGETAAVHDEHRWPQARRQVLQALTPVAQDRTGNYMRRRCYPRAQALVTQMVQQSSRQLAALGALGA